MRQKPSPRSLTAAIAAAVLAGAGLLWNKGIPIAIAQIQSGATPASAPFNANSKLSGQILERTWTLVSWEGFPPFASSPAGNRPTIQFADGAVSGSGGCNNYGGQYQLTGKTSIEISSLVSTKRACAEMALNEQEERFFRALETASTIELSDRGQLKIWYRDSNGSKGVLIFSTVAGDRG